LQERNLIEKSSTKKITSLKTEISDTFHELETMLRNATQSKSRTDMYEILGEALNIITTSKATISNT
jgi:hypothetical protein